MQRHRAPPSSLRLHRFSRGGRPRWKKVVPLLLPLVVGFGVAVLVDALLPKPAVVAAAPAPAPAPAPTVRPTLVLGEMVLSTTPPDPTATATAPTTTLTTTTTTTASAAPQEKRPTRDASLEKRIDAMLENGKTPYSAVVVMEAQTGRILAVAEHSTRGAADGLALRPMAPAASVFKIVTSSALLEQGVSRGERVCFHGGKTRMQPAQLKDDAKRDHACVAFDDIVPFSANVALAKLASRHLTPELLRAQADKWGFGHARSAVDGEVASTAVIPDAGFDFATTAAGFGDVKISALQGAAIASIVANDGVYVPASDDRGDDVEPRRVISPQTAKALKAMMTATVTEGTGKAFRQSPRLPISAGGKTGSLTDYKTGLDTSWFVGFAPADAPVLVVAAVVVNTSKWHIKAPWLAKESLRLALKDHGPPTPAGRVAAR